MKKIIQVLTIAVILCIPFILIAQPLPYDPAIGGGEGSNPVGGGAPLTGGLLIMLSLGIGYGMKKTVDLRNNKKNLTGT